MSQDAKGIVSVFPYPQGGYKGSEADISLTALVLIALDEGKELCSQKIPVGSKEEGGVYRVPYPLPTGSSPTVMLLSVHPRLLTCEPFSPSTSLWPPLSV